MIPPESYVLPTWELEEGDAGVTKADSTSVFLSSGPYYPDTSPYSTPIDQVDLDPVGVQDLSSAFLVTNSPSDSNNFDATFALLDLTQGQVPWISSGLEYGLRSVSTEAPLMNDVPQTSDEVHWRSVSESSFDSLLISHTTNPNPQASFLGQTMEGSFRNTADSYAFTVVDILPPGWGIDQPEAGFSPVNSSTIDSADPAVWIDGSLYLAENIRMVNAEPEAVQSPNYAAISSFEQQLILSEEPISHCEWQDEAGSVCGEVLSRETLPGHLSKHGIKNMRRDLATKCNWVGCKKKRPMNRESIVRHIREVHMRLRRSSKVVQ